MNLHKDNNTPALAVGGIAALLASTCCLSPLLLVLLGFSGAWIGSLSKLEPYRPFFLALTLIALGTAGYRIFRKPTVCTVTGSCATPRTKRIQIIAFCAVIALALIAFAFPYLAPLFY